MITIEQYIEMQRRLGGMAMSFVCTEETSGEEREMPLHDKIMAWCNSQHPRVKYIRARSDRESTIQVGAQDFTLFLPNGRLLCIECKSATGKLTHEQQAWSKEMEMLGHAVHVVRSMEEFMKLI